MAFSFNPDDDNDLDEMLNELREKLIQSDRENMQADLQFFEITKLIEEKSKVLTELKQFEVANQKLQAELTIAIKTAEVSERQKHKLQVDHSRLLLENDVLKTENKKLSTTQTHITAELSDLSRKHGDLLDKVSTWCKLYEEVSEKQSQSQAGMLELAKQIGHAKASTVYILQLKQQVEQVYKNLFNTIKQMQESNEEPRAKIVMGNQDDKSFRIGGMDGKESSDWNKPEQYWKTVNEKLRIEMQNYKEELWAGLKSLNQLSDNKIAGSSPHRDT